MPAWLIPLLSMLAGSGAGALARHGLKSATGQAAKAAVGGLARKAIPAKLGQRVGAGVAKLPSSVKRAGGSLGSAAENVAVFAGVDFPAMMLIHNLLGGQQPTQIHGENSLAPPQGGADELTNLLASLGGGMEGGDLDALDLEELLSKFSPPAQERRLI